MCSVRGRCLDAGRSYGCCAQPHTLSIRLSPQGHGKEGKDHPLHSQWLSSRQDPGHLPAQPTAFPSGTEALRTGWTSWQESQSPQDLEPGSLPAGVAVLFLPVRLRVVFLQVKGQASCYSRQLPDGGVGAEQEREPCQERSHTASRLKGKAHSTREQNVLGKEEKDREEREGVLSG